jgi:anti-anti-sigma factor
MKIAQHTFRDAIVLDLADEFTFSSRKEFSAALNKEKLAGCRHLLLNFKHVTFVDSAAIGLLALAAQQFKLENRILSLVSPQGTVKQVLELANIPKMIPVFPSEEAATNAQAA